MIKNFTTKQYTLSLAVALTLCTVFIAEYYSHSYYGFWYIALFIRIMCVAIYVFICLFNISALYILLVFTSIAASIDFRSFYLCANWILFNRWIYWVFIIHSAVRDILIDCVAKTKLHNSHSFTDERYETTEIVCARGISLE